MKIKLTDIFKGKVVIVGIGNIMKNDDGFGPGLVNRLKNRIKSVCIDAGSAPENYTGKIIKEKPGTILIIDAVDLGLNPGDYEILQISEIIKSGFTTHDISPSLFMEYLKNETKARIYMLGVQPKDVSFGQSISPELKKTLKVLEKEIKEENHA